VRIYSRILNERGRAVFLGEATTDDEGAFELLVPVFAR
jgi:hypothetical protein